ncbi:MAG: PLP-dependent aminotransferase family protein [Lautropia sp.]|nr:PLP-dependent aminotransferase family protein [Lautropia sp.]
MADKSGRHEGVMWQALWAPYRQQGMSLQEQVRQMLVAVILEGLLPASALLPSTRELSLSLGVSRNTIIIVYQRLCDEGYLVAESRTGYRVASGTAGLLVPRAQQRVATAGAPRAVRPPHDPLPRGFLANENALRPPVDVVKSPGRWAFTGPATQPDLLPDWEGRLLQPPSRQRNIQKRRDWYNYPWPFLYGQFDASSFPMADWRQCCLRTLNALAVNEWGRDMFLEDEPGLIRQIRTRLLPQRGIHVDEENILVTVGSQHALHLLADLLVDERVRVGIENPGYPDARNIFARRRARLQALAVDGEGVVPSRLMHACDYLYVTPSHQCPTMVRMSMARRETLLEKAARHDIVLIEDDYDTASVADQRPMPALKSLDRDQRVIYLGSFSKSVAPGLRLGYLVGARELVAELRCMRRLSIRHPNVFIQRVMAQFLAMGHYHSLQRRLGEVQAARAACLRDALARHLPMCSVNEGHGGTAFWIEGPRGLDARRLGELAEGDGVLIEPGDVFFMSSDGACPFFRMGFTSIAERDIDSGVARLAAVMGRLRRENP